MPPALEVFVRFLRLGCVAFGGPVAHLGYFRREFVGRARWLDDAAFTETVALCSILPGPTSSQVGMLVGARRAGPLGALAAWLGFTAPTALVLATAGLALRIAGERDAAFVNSPAFGGVLEGFGAAAAAVVLIAVVQLARSIVTTPLAAGTAAAAFVLALLSGRFAPAFQWVALVAGAALGWAFVRGAPALPGRAPALRISRNAAFASGGAFLAILIGAPIVAQPGTYGELFATFFRAGSLVFGGGHVVLPFLRGLAGASIPERTFFAGYGLTQALPGPLFAFSAFLGASARPAGGGIGALIALVAIFLPSFLLLAAVVPLWTALRQLPRAADVLAGVNAAVVGLLAAVFVDPIAASLARDPLGIALGLVAALLLGPLRVPAPLVVLGCATVGGLVRGFVRAGSGGHSGI